VPASSGYPPSSHTMPHAPMSIADALRSTPPCNLGSLEGGDGGRGGGPGSPLSPIMGRRRPRGAQRAVPAGWPSMMPGCGKMTSYGTSGRLSPFDTVAFDTVVDVILERSDDLS
jgi:hypothetical protein